MKDSSDNYFLVLEQWLQVLLMVYQYTPNHQVIQFINYYLSRILAHENCQLSARKVCQYQQMKKFWQWRLQALTDT